MYTPASGIKLEPIRMSAVVDTGVITTKSSAKAGYVHPNKRAATQIAGPGLIEFNDTDFPSLSMAAVSVAPSKMNYKNVVNEFIEKEKANLLNIEQDTNRSWSDMTPQQREKAGIISISGTKNSRAYQASSDTYGQLQ
jgi:translation elongation factor EF-Ts